MQKMKIIEITAGVRKVLRDLEGGETITITHRAADDPEPSYVITGGGKHRSDVLAAAFVALREAGMLQEVDKGLFEGCGQTFIVIK